MDSLVTNYPNGVSSYGVTVLGGNSIPTTNGKYWFVSSVTGSSSADGRSMGTPKATIAQAIAAATASNGDIIICLQGHAEAIGSAAAIALSKAGITIIGLGAGANRPTLTWGTATTATMTVTAANVVLSNFVLDMTGFDAVASGIVVSAANFQLSGCKVILATASAQATLGILTTAAADGMKILGNQFLGSADAGCAAAIRIVGGNEHVIDGNYCHGNFTTTLGFIDNVTTATLRTQVSNNYIFNGTASSAVAMTFVATSTGMIFNNRMQVLTGTAPIVGAAMSWVGGNYYAATIATAGTLI